MASKTDSHQGEHKAVTNFRDYLKIKTVQPHPDYDEAIVFLSKMADELQLPHKTLRIQKDQPIFWMTWEGTNASLPSLLLNSHTDVVPVFPEYWKYDAFDAHKDEKGDIYARGSQDMKCVGIQYIEAIRRLREKGARFERTIHLLFVPEEEVGGQGMKDFLQSPDFKAMNVGFALDEGLANPTDSFMVYYGERSPWWLKITCAGDPGHGSQFIQNNPGEKVRRVINSFMAFRDEQEKKLKSDPNLRLGDVTTVNLTMLDGGVQMNVVPAELFVFFDVRITPTTDLVKLENDIKHWCEQAGEGVTYTFIQKNTNQKLTKLEGNPFWTAFKDVFNKLNIRIETTIFPAATDSRFLREADIAALGFSPMNHTPVLLHDHNEFLNEDIFLKGIDVYFQLIPALASVKG